MRGTRAGWLLPLVLLAAGRTVLLGSPRPQNQSETKPSSLFEYVLRLQHLHDALEVQSARGRGSPRHAKSSVDAGDSSARLAATLHEARRLREGSERAYATLCETQPDRRAVWERLHKRAQGEYAGIEEIVLSNGSSPSEPRTGEDAGDGSSSRKARLDRGPIPTRRRTADAADAGQSAGETPNRCRAIGKSRAPVSPAPSSAGQARGRRPSEDAGVSRTLVLKPRATYEDLLWLLMRAIAPATRWLAERPTRSSYERCVCKLIRHRWLNPDEVCERDVQLTRGMAALPLARLLGLDGGVSGRLFGLKERSAYHDLVFAGVMADGGDAYPMSGAELVSAFSRARDLKARRECGDR